MGSLSTEEASGDLAGMGYQLEGDLLQSSRFSPGGSGDVKLSVNGDILLFRPLVASAPPAFSNSGLVAGSGGGLHDIVCAGGGKMWENV